MHLFSTDERCAFTKDWMERLEKVERGQNGLQLEWADALERITKMLARLRERQKALERMEPREPDEPTEEISVDRAPGLVPSTHGLLTPRQKEIQQNILKRRAGG